MIHQPLRLLGLRVGKQAGGPQGLVRQQGAGGEQPWACLPVGLPLLAAHPTAHLHAGQSSEAADRILRACVYAMAMSPGCRMPR